MSRIAKKFLPIAWIIPPTFLAIWVFLFGVDVLQWDEWVIWGEALAKIKAGTFNIADLAAQQNEQRNLAARLFGFMLLPFFKLNRFAELGLNILIAAGIFLTARRLYARTADEVIPQTLLLAFSLLSFSMIQWEAFTFGINSSVLVLPLGIWLGALLASSGPPTLPRLTLLGLIGILPSFSFANGLFYWVCLAPLIFYHGKKSGRAVSATLIWSLMTCVAWGLYFMHFESPGHHPSPLSGLASPLKLTGYFFAYLGGAVSSDRNLLPLALALGFLSLPATLFLLHREWKANGERRKNMLPWAAVALFSILSAAVTSSTRCAFGLEQALASRYATFATPYWMTLIALFATAWNRGERGRSEVWCQKLLAVCLATFMLSTVLSSIVVYNRHDRILKAKRALFSLTDEAGLHPIFPDTAYLMEKLPLFLEKRLSIYRGIKPFADYPRATDPAGRFSATPALGAEGRLPGILLKGTTKTNQKHVLIVVQETILGVSKPYENGQWELFMPSSTLPENSALLHAYSLDEADTLAPLAPIAGLPVIAPQEPTPQYTFQNYFFTK